MEKGGKRQEGLWRKSRSKRQGGALRKRWRKRQAGLRKKMGKKCKLRWVLPKQAGDFNSTVT